MLPNLSSVLILSSLLCVQVGLTKAEDLAHIPKSQALNCANSTERSSICSNNSSKEDISFIPTIEKQVYLRKRDSYSNNNCSANTDQETPEYNTSLECSSITETETDRKTQTIRPDENKAIEVYIETPNNDTHFEPGLSITIKCMFTAPLNQDLKFSLRWLRSVVASQGSNQSIINTDTDSMTIIAATTRIWTVQRNGGLDLELNDFQAIDVGEYFCQAISTYSGSILSEAKTNLNIKKYVDSLPPLVDDNGIGIVESSSQAEKAPNLNDNLSKLLPSLQVVPEFSELALGESIQLVCVTSELDPDPEPNEIEWTFEPVPNRSQLLYQQPQVLDSLPNNVTVLGNALMIWSMTEQHSGNYRCTNRLREFNLSSQAVGEVTLSSLGDSAPLVFVTPELIRVSPNKSVTIQCEASGYPVPEVIWYRVEENSGLSLTDEHFSSSIKNLEESNKEDGLHFELIPYKDTAIYCKQQKCVSQNENGRKKYEQTTGVSLIHINRAQSKHQGQYVCRANNKHGSNQASSVVDVEFKELPIVKVDSAYREQKIELGVANNPESFQNVTFKCSIEAGRPKPRLRWLRMINKEKISQDIKLTNFDLYDLTKVSSATSKVATWLENNGKSLVLSLSTVSLDDEGEYICLGENNWGRHSAVARLIVSKPLSLKIVQNSPFVAKVNESFYLECLASGHPIPTDIEWSRTDRGAFFSFVTRNSSNYGNQEKATLKFDRVNTDDSGEYTCNARNSVDSSIVLRDTIMVLVEEAKTDSERNLDSSRVQNSYLPKLMVRPTKANVQLGSNVTFDCLAVSGLQPTLVKWIAPSNEPDESGAKAESNSSNLTRVTYIQPYYQGGSTNGHLLQYGSKLKIFNVSKSHEGVYQCRGSNKIGIENAPALLKVTLPDTLSAKSDTPNKSMADTKKFMTSEDQTKSKVAKIGSNIELKCQVNGVEQPATSWSREGSELPISSVQIEHNLWIQNVSSKDNGLYICSARSKQPNKVIQAAIRLIVDTSSDSNGRLKNLFAKIVASKNIVNIGDSVTLECIVNHNSSSFSKKVRREEGEEVNDEDGQELNKSINLDEVERNVVWTNLHSGQALFQDNVYVQDNLLIIYDLRSENSATYRCNYNELSQYVDYKLRINDSTSKEALNDTTNASLVTHTGISTEDGTRVELKQAALNSHIVLECLNETQATTYNESPLFKWIRGRHKRHIIGNRPSLVFESIQTEDADLYSCFRISSSEHQDGELVKIYVVQVIVPIARFLQRPVSFITLPTISNANHQLDIELKFLIERETGLILFNGQQITASANMTYRPIPGDYISLGLNRGYLEFRFELGDGTTLLRSAQTLALNVWHHVIIERNRRGAVMWLDKQPPVSNSSTGKFFNLNLDSVLYVGGHQHFMSKPRPGHNLAANSRFYGYPRGFQGCISLLRILHQEINLMARNRSVAVGIFECDKQECKASNCDLQNSVCQVDHSLSRNESKLDLTSRISPTSDLRCICFPGYTGVHCSEKQISPNTNLTIEHKYSSDSLSANLSLMQTIRSTTPVVSTTLAPTTTSARQIKTACETLNQACYPNGTIECQSLTTISFKCHCRLGFVGEFCAEPAIFDSETSVAFNQQAYVQLRFNKPEEVRFYLEQEQQQRHKQQPGAINPPSLDSNTKIFNESNFARLTSTLENQEISFKLQTKSSYGLIFYTGQVFISPRISKEFVQIPTLTPQSSKSMVANLLSRLSSSVFDYLAIALVDGHVELSYELGSGVAIVRSLQRVNDGLEHKIRVLRNATFARLTIDDIHKYEGNSPGKLTMLNSEPDIYLGGLPNLSELTNNSHMSDFSGCISELEINSLGPLNLIRSDQTSQVRSARNLVPCKPVVQVKQKPYQAPTDTDDPDET